MDLLFAALVEDHILQYLEILTDSCPVTINTVLELCNDTYGLSLLVDHLERTGYLPYLHGVNNLSHLWREILHLET